MITVKFSGVELMLKNEAKWDQLSTQAQQELIAQVRRGMAKPVVVDAQAHVIEGEEILLAAIKGKVRTLSFVVVAASMQETPSLILPSQMAEPAHENSSTVLKVSQSQCRQWAQSQTDPQRPLPRTLDRFCVFANKPADLQRALQAMREIDPEMLPNRRLAVRSLVTLARKQKAQTLAALATPPWVRPGIELHCGDFRELGAKIPDDSIEGLDTDPPYDKASIDLYAESAMLAMRVLKPGGLYIAYTGKMYLPQVYAALEKSGLEFVWQCAITHNTGHNITWPRRMISGYKPILVYRKPGGPPIDWSPILDVCSEGKQEQNLHPWQQALAESEYFMKKLFAPGSTVLDPMMGSGTTLVAAMNCGMNAIGFEQDPVTFETAKKRIEDHFASLATPVRPEGA
jgi:site-specific DNA-methyltransferase (adenine-specific)